MGAHKLYQIIQNNTGGESFENRIAQKHTNCQSMKKCNINITVHSHCKAFQIEDSGKAGKGKSPFRENQDKRST